MTENYPDYMFEEAECREEKNEKQFYRFFAVEYYGTGEGLSYWLKICRNYPSNNDYEMERFKKFIGNEFYYGGIEELTEEEFMKKYTNLIPHHIKVCIERRDQPMLTWKTHFHVNYS